MLLYFTEYLLYSVIKKKLIIEIVIKKNLIHVYGVRFLQTYRNRACNVYLYHIRCAHKKRTHVLPPSLPALPPPEKGRKALEIAKAAAAPRPTSGRHSRASGPLS